MIAALRAEVVKRDAVIERREAAVVRARAALEIAIAREQRAAEDALALAIEDVAAAKEVRAEAAANVTAELAMRESFVPVLESTARVLKSGLNPWTTVRVRPALGSAPARLSRLLSARLAAPGSSTLPGGETGPLGAQPRPRVLERAASQVTDATAL